MVHYYIYYRIDPASLLQVTRAVGTMLESMERLTGVRGRWMRRRDDPTTCMEVYEGVVDEAVFEAALASLAAVTAAIGLERHLECFTDASVGPPASV